MGAYLLYWLLGIILLPGIIFATYAQAKISSVYKEMKHQPASTDKTADKIAREILDKNGLENVQIEQVDGEMTDYFHPKKQIVALSKGTYGSNSIASIGIAAHEVGHAIQTNEGYFASKIRSFMVPFVNFSSAILWPLVIIGLLFNIFGSVDSVVGTVFIWCGIGFFGLSLLFSLITLPTELDASKRAMQQLREGGYFASEEEADQVKSVLKAAAMTYFASLVMSILNFFRFIITLLVLRNNN